VQLVAAAARLPYTNVLRALSGIAGIALMRARPPYDTGPRRLWVLRLVSLRIGDAAAACSVFFLVDDGIRVLYVTGVQTCALPISGRDGPRRNEREVCMRRRPAARIARGAAPAAELLQIRTGDPGLLAQLARRAIQQAAVGIDKIGRASCRERL